MAIYDINGNVVNTGDSGYLPHAGEKAFCIGDSNMQYWQSVFTKNKLSDCLAKCGITSFENYAQSGSHWYTSGYDLTTTDRTLAIGQINEFVNNFGANQTDYTLCLMLFGTNDHESDLGSFSDVSGANTTVGYMRYAIDKLLSIEAFAKGALFGIIPCRRYDGIDTEAQLRAKVDMIKTVYEDYSIPYADMYYAGNVRQIDMRSTDNVHYNEDGRKKLCDCVSSLINSH